MILRKPYAFIIKHFRLIHIILLVMLVYIFVDLSEINNLFNDFQRTNTYTYIGGSLYIDELINYAIYVSLFLSGVLLFLLRKKNKPVNLYIGLVVYFIALFFGYLYIHSQLNAIVTDVFESEQILRVKDFTFLFSIPMWGFIPFCFIRGIGFNIKQFNFSKDIAELKIADEDSQEFELLIGQNNYKYFRTARRILREIKYFIFENLFPITLISSGVGVIILGLGVYYYNEYMKKIDASEVTSIDSISYVVNKAYMTSRDFNGTEIRDGYKYVVVDMAFHNVSTKSKFLNLDMITLADGNIIYYPTLTKNSKFYDFGVPYHEKQEIFGGQMLEATLTFEIPKSVRTKNFVLRVQYGIDDSYKKIIVKYKNFDVKTTNVDSKNNKKPISKKVGDMINVNIVGENNIDLTVTGYQTMDSFDNKYVSCKNMETCHFYSSLIRTSSVLTNTMLVVDFKSQIDSDAKILKTFNTTNKLFKNYATIKYLLYNKEYIVEPIIVTNSDVDHKVFFDVPRQIVNASEIHLQFDFRDDLYIVNLKK